jgi:uncharacterized protein (TIGR02646 family)
MHKLDREAVDVPECLRAPAAGRTYKDLHRDEIAQIRAALLDVQKSRCAYCERLTGGESHEGHVEHFQQQSPAHAAGAPNRSLDWTNLFWSCRDQRTCGKHKDNCTKNSGQFRRYEPDDLIDPAQEDPDLFLFFAADGTVHVREGLDEAAARRAAETIRVFQLKDSALLCQARKAAVEPFARSAQFFLAAGPELLRKWASSEIPAVAAAPFGTAIKHFLLSVV